MHDSFLPDDLVQQEVVRAIMQVELDMLRVTLAQDAADDPDVPVSSGEKASEALVRLAEGKARLVAKYSDVLTGGKSDDEEAEGSS